MAPTRVNAGTMALCQRAVCRHAEGNHLALPRFDPGAVRLRAERAARAHLQRAPPRRGAAADKPDAAASQTARAVMSGEQVIRILDDTVNWYRMLGVQQQSSTQPSDLLILYANRQTADRVVALAFELARANAELLSSQAEVETAKAPDPSAHELSLQEKQGELDKRRASIQSEIAAAQKQLADAKAGERTELQAKIAELQSELELVNARRNMLGTMVDFAHETDANGSGVSALKEHINAIAASIPAAAPGAMPELGGSDPAGDAPGGRRLSNSRVRARRDVGRSRFGIWDLTSERAEAFEQARDDRRHRQTHSGAAENVRADSLGAREADQGACGSRRRAPGAARRE